MFPGVLVVVRPVLGLLPAALLPVPHRRSARPRNRRATPTRGRCRQVGAERRRSSSARRIAWPWQPVKPGPERLTQHVDPNRLHVDTPLVGQFQRPPVDLELAGLTLKQGRGRVVQKALPLASQRTAATRGTHSGSPAASCSASCRRSPAGRGALPPPWGIAGYPACLSDLHLATWISGPSSCLRGSTALPSARRPLPAAHPGRRHAARDPPASPPRDRRRTRRRRGCSEIRHPNPGYRRPG